MTSWGEPYEVPTMLDAGRVIGRHSLRPSLCALGGIAAVLLGGTTTVAFDQPLFAAPMVPLLLGAYAFAAPWRQRPLEHWLGVWARDRRMPRTLEERALARWHADVEVRGHAAIDRWTKIPRAVVEIEQPINLRLSDDATLGSHIQRFGAFLNGLRFPIQLVVRAWVTPENLIHRRWFVAVSAETDAVLEDRLSAVVSGLGRAGLRGRPKNGDQYDTLQACWTAGVAHHNRVGPSIIKRSARHAVVDGELVRGFWLARMPRTVEPNWLAPVLDGDVPVDMGLWLEPTDTTEEISNLDTRMVEYQARQIRSMLDTGINDLGADEVVEDFRRVRTDLSRRRARIFRSSVSFVVRGKTIGELEGRERLLVDLLREQVGDHPVVSMDYQHDLGPLLVTPLAEPAARYPLRMVTQALARSYPFSNSSLSMAGGVEVGTSLNSNRPNRLDLFGFANPHMLVLATSGAGKGYWTKVYLRRWMKQEPNLTVFVIQVYKDEYGPLVDSLQSHECIDRKIDIATSQDVDDLIRYDRLWVPGVRCAVLNLLPMDERERGQALARLIVAIDGLTAWVKEKDPDATRRFALVIDELGIVLDDAEAERAVARAFRSFRHNRCACIGISQRPSDLLSRRVGKVLADIALAQVYLRQRPTEMRVVSKVLGLSPEEQTLLEEADVGTGILVADHQHVGFHLTATREENVMARTD